MKGRRSPIRTALTLVFGVALTAPAHARAQAIPSGPQPLEPEAVADAFFHGLGRLQWTRIVDLLSPEALASFDLVAGQIVESLRGDSVLIQLYGTTLEDFRSWSDRESFVRTTSAMVDYARGLMESQVTTDVEILGSVVEGDSLAHVVYRERTDHMGTLVEDVEVTTLVRQDDRWLVLRNDELDVLESALRGLPIGRTPPPGPGPVGDTVPRRRPGTS